MAKGGDENERIRALIQIDKATLPPDGGERFNRLIFATSPYLLQHADNPVDWYPWGEDAFSAARRENKPVFLSIGYATCHWCHVMAHESFEDPSVAEVINRHFVPVKVDREERPDVDSQYMTVAQMMTGSGGWPLTVVMTPEGAPFFAATYLPRSARGGMPGIVTILDRISQFWRMEPDKVAENCTTIIETLRRYNRPPSPTPTGRDPELAAARQLENMYDPDRGGFGDAPKFPMPLNILFLLRQGSKTGNLDLLRMADTTLRRMREGGIFDQFGFGFHRYSVDAEWLAPHFEKMLYDQALLAVAYLEAYQATGDVFHRRVADEVFNFVLRELTSPEGSFYAALDADSEGEEGKFYLWTPHEVETVLGEKAARFCGIFDITPGGNFEGRSIPRLQVPLEKVAEEEKKPVEELYHVLEPLRERMLKLRQARIRPFLDTKSIAAWNGMMIAAFAKGYAVTGEEAYLTAAVKCASFINRRLTRDDGRLLRSFNLGSATVPGFLEDYAAVSWGFLSLFEATLRREYRDAAVELVRDMVRLFGSESGVFYDSGNDTEKVLLRARNFHDGVIPSGNSLAAIVLLKLGKGLRDPELTAAGRAILAALSGKMSQQPTAHLGFLIARSYVNGSAPEFTFSSADETASVREMLFAIHRRYLPDAVIRLASDNEQEYRSDGTNRLFVCAKGACRPPVSTVPELDALLDSLLSS